MKIEKLNGKFFARCPHCKHKFMFKLNINRDENDRIVPHSEMLKITDEISFSELLDEIQLVIEDYNKEIKRLNDKLDDYEDTLEAVTDY